MSALELLVGAVATWRVSYMLLNENGPFEVFRRIRKKLGVIYADNDSTEVVAFQYEITVCMWCLSVWVGMLIATLYYLLGSYATWLIAPYVLSAGALLVDAIRRID